MSWIIINSDNMTSDEFKKIISNKYDVMIIFLSVKNISNKFYKKINVTQLFIYHLYNKYSNKYLSKFIKSRKNIRKCYIF